MITEPEPIEPMNGSSVSSSTGFLGGRLGILEAGSGSNNTLDDLESSLAVASDLSLDMLRARASRGPSYRLAAVGEAVPFGNDQLDGVFLINVLEHVADFDEVISEGSWVMADNGIWAAVTPNGNRERWLTH